MAGIWEGRELGETAKKFRRLPGFLPEIRRRKRGRVGSATEQMRRRMGRGLALRASVRRGGADAVREGGQARAEARTKPRKGDPR